MPTTVLIVDDHPSFRATARMLLECDSGWTVAGEAATGAEALVLAQELQPDLVLLDVNLPDTDGFAVAAALEGIAVVLVSSRDANDYGPRVAASGALAFLTKADLSGDALREVLAR